MDSFVGKFESFTIYEKVRCDDLVISMKYPITERVDVVRTLKRILVKNSKRLLKVYLLKRYAKKFTDEELQDIQPDTLYLQCNGQKDCVTEVNISQF